MKGFGWRGSRNYEKKDRVRLLTCMNRKKHQREMELTKNVSRSSCSSGDGDCNNWRGDTQGLEHLIHWRVLDGDQVNGRLQRKEPGGCGGEV